MELIAKDIFRRDYFKSYSEFYLALCIGEVLKEKGYCLNIDGMYVDSDAIPDKMLNYYKGLLNEGALVLSSYTPNTNDNVDMTLSVDTSFYKDVDLFYIKDGELCWDLDYARENYKGISVRYFSLKTLGFVLMHIIAWHIVDCILKGDVKKLNLYINSPTSKSTFVYANIYSCLSSLRWFRDFVNLEVDLEGYEADLEYSIFCNNGFVAGRHKPHTVSEKLKLLEKYGMVEGSILALWRRDKMCENNIFGRITSVTFVRIEEIGDTYVGVTKISLNKTKEEVEEDYYSIDESKRYLYTDLLSKKPYQEATELDIHSLAIDNYLYDEHEYLTLLDEEAMVDKLVTVDGKKVTLTMSNVDAVYWLLRQYEIEFDSELYKKMYFGDTVPLWDVYN